MDYFEIKMPHLHEKPPILKYFCLLHVTHTQWDKKKEKLFGSTKSDY